MDTEQLLLKWNTKDKRDALRKLRRITGVSLSELAGRAGLSQSMISKYELGQRDLSLEAIAALRKAVQPIIDEHDRTVRRKALLEKADSREMGELLGHFVPLSSLGGREAHEAYQKKLERRRAEMAQEYGPHWQEVFEALFKYRDMEKRLAELQDVLGMKTKAVVLDAEAEEKIESIQRVPSDGLEG